MPTAPHPRPRHPHAGFTLVEMMVVIGLIVILISILLPTISGVRKRGYDARTRATVAKLSAACHAYFADFHAYPGPLADSELVPFQRQIAGVTKPVTGSENLVLGLLGGLSNNGGWQYQAVQSGPFSLNPSNPKQYTAYVNAEAGELSNGVFAGSDAPDGAQDSEIQEFVDSWGDQQAPIIYARARQGAHFVVDDGEDQPTGSTDTQYRMIDFATYTGNPPAKSKTRTQSEFRPPNGDLTFYADWWEVLRNEALSPAADPKDPRAPQPGTAEVAKGKDSFVIIAQGISRNWGKKDLIISAE